MTRKTASTINDAELDELYAERDRYAAVLLRIEQRASAWERQLPDTIRTAPAVEAIRSLVRRAEPITLEDLDTPKETR